MYIKININNEVFYVKDYVLQNINNNFILILNSHLLNNISTNDYIDLSNINLCNISSNVYTKSTIQGDVLPQTYIDEVVHFMLEKKKETDVYCDTVRSSLGL